MLNSQQFKIFWMCWYHAKYFKFEGWQKRENLPAHGGEGPLFALASFAGQARHDLK